MGSSEGITLYGCSMNGFSHVAQEFCQFPVATDATCYLTGCVGVSAGPSRHPLHLQTLYPRDAEGPGTGAGLKWTTPQQKVWKGRGNRDVTTCSCPVLPAPKLHLGYPEIIKAELKSCKAYGGGRRQLYMAVQGMGRAGREVAESKQASRGSTLSSTRNTLDPKPLLRGLYLPVCLHVHECWLPAVL